MVSEKHLQGILNEVVEFIEIHILRYRKYAIGKRIKRWFKILSKEIPNKT